MFYWKTSLHFLKWANKKSFYYIFILFFSTLLYHSTVIIKFNNNWSSSQHQYHTSSGCNYSVYDISILIMILFIRVNFIWIDIAKKITRSCNRSLCSDHTRTTNWFDCILGVQSFESRLQQIGDRVSHLIRCRSILSD